MFIFFLLIVKEITIKTALACLRPSSSPVKDTAPHQQAGCLETPELTAALTPGPSCQCTGHSLGTPRALQPAFRTPPCPPAGLHQLWDPRGLQSETPGPGSAHQWVPSLAGFLHLPPGRPCPWLFAPGSGTGWPLGAAATVPVPLAPRRTCQWGCPQDCRGWGQRDGCRLPWLLLPALGLDRGWRPTWPRGPGNSCPCWHLNPALSPARASLQSTLGRSSVSASPYQTHLRASG